jgi:hypothetical protein
MRPRRQEWRQQRLERTAGGEDVVHHQHTRTWWNLKAAAKLAANRASFTRNLFGEDAAHAEEAADLIGEQHAASGWSGNKVNLNRSGGGNGERAFGEEAADLCRSVWMLEQCPLL